MAVNYARITLIIVVFLALGVSFFVYNSSSVQQSSTVASNENTNPEVKHYKILHVMSYHTPWEWTEEQLAGFKEQLSDLDVEYKVYEMNTKLNSSEEHKQQAGAEASALVESWKPDLVYTNDDNAQKYFAKYYINSSIPFVFSGVNSDPSVYGFRGSTNMAGIIEEEHIVQTVNLLKQVVPNATRIVVIIDDDPSWPGTVTRTEEKLSAAMPEIQLIEPGPIHTYDQFKANVTYYQNKADALLVIGVHTFKNENGTNVPFQQALQWITENSNLPDITFWKDRIPYGTMLTVAVSGHEHGIAAGKMARSILVDKVSPSSLSFTTTTKGDVYISLARADRLGIQISSSLLLAAHVNNQFDWAK